MKLRRANSDPLSPSPSLPTQKHPPSGHEESSRFGGLAAATIFVGAFLLFQVQPMISKTILPWFGGSPAVWTTCLLFFQIVLLGGYAYAHALARVRSPVWHAVIHTILLIVALVALLTTSPSDFRPQTSADPTGKILMLLGISIGLPYFMLSTTGPLVQTWFARVYAHRSPYRLYALSNIGSLLALMSYPIFIERLLTLRMQDLVWSTLFTVYVILCSLLAFDLWRRAAKSGVSEPVVNEGDPVDATAGDSVRLAATQATGAATGQPVTVKTVKENFRSTQQRKSKKKKKSRRHGRRDTQSASLDVVDVDRKKQSTATHESTWYDPIIWVILPALSSVMLLAVTNHLSQNVAVIPMLWIAPLSLYLVSFIICFDRQSWYRPRWFGLMTVVAVLFLSNLMIAKNFKRVYTNSAVTLPLESWNAWLPGQMSAYLITLFLICMVCHGEVVYRKPAAKHLTSFYLCISAGGAMGGLLVALVFPQLFVSYVELGAGLLLCFLIGCGVVLRDAWRDWFVGKSAIQMVGVAILVTGASVVAWSEYLSAGQQALVRKRNFYGLISVKERYYEGHPFHSRVLYHGDTFHGLQFLSEENRKLPSLYFAPQTGCGYVFEHYPRQGAKQDGPLRVAVIGLGVGTMAAYGKEGDRFRFYDIDPEVAEVANEYFTYLKDSPAEIDVVIGDGRLAMQQEPEPLDLDVMVLDAFSSDAIPSHLLTDEALDVYLDHLKDPDKALLAFHISNRYLDLRPVVTALGISHGFTTLEFDLVESDPGNRFAACTWMVLTRNEQFLNDPAVRRVSRVSDPNNTILWTDQYNNLLQVFE